jgi:Tol biopolymer transport system component
MRRPRFTHPVALAAALCILSSGCDDDGPTGPSLPGDRLLVLRSDGPHESELILMTSDGGDVQPVTVPSPLPASRVVPSPDGRRFAYIAPDEAQRYCLSIVGIDGARSIRTRACDTTGGDRPVWSPDGARVAARVGDHVWIARVAGPGAGSALSIDAPGYGAPVWAPDGRRLALVLEGGDARDPGLGWLVTASADGQPLTTRANVQVNSPVSWSPDGQWLAARARGATSVDELRLYAAGGGLTTRVLVDADVAVVQRDLVWSPDGARLAFVGSDAAVDQSTSELWNRLDVYVVQIADGRLTRLTPESGSYARIVWSPAGDRLAFSGVPGGTIRPYRDYDVWVAAADATSAPVRVTAYDEYGETVVGWTAAR